MAETTVAIPTRVLVLGMAHEDGTIHAAELYPAAEACGQGPEQVRSCLRRLVNEGRFVRQGEGREARFVPTERGMAELATEADRTHLAYAQDAAGTGWDGHWRLVAFAIPEVKRAARDAVRDHLLHLGGAQVQNALYVSPHRWEPEVRAEAKRQGVEAHVTLASTDALEIGGVRDPRELARQLWPLDDLAARYRQFCEAYRQLPERLRSMRERRERLTDTSFLPGALRMAVAFRACFDGDPLLPPELLPRPWPGREARDILLRSRREALLARADHERPVLFRIFDDVADHVL